MTLLFEFAIYIPFAFFLSSQILEFISTVKKNRLMVRQTRFYKKCDAFQQRLYTESLILQAENLMTEGMVGIEKEQWKELNEEKISAIEHDEALWKLDRQDIEENLEFITKYKRILQTPDPLKMEFDTLINEWRIILSDRESFEDIPFGQEQMDEMKIIRQAFGPEPALVERLNRLEKRLMEELQSRH